MTARRRYRRWIGMFTLLVASTALAQEMRTIRPIGRTQALPQGPISQALPEGAVRVLQHLPVPPQAVEAALAGITRAWNERRLDAVLTSGYNGRQELTDALQVKVPRDATLRVVSIQGWQVLDQYRLGPRLYSRLAVQVQTRMEFNDATGFQGREGVNTYVMTLGHAEGG